MTNINPGPEPQLSVQQHLARIEHLVQVNIPALRAYLQDVLRMCKTLDEVRLVQQSLNRLGNISSRNSQQVAELRKEIMPSVVTKLRQLTPKSTKSSVKGSKSTTSQKAAVADSAQPTEQDLKDLILKDSATIDLLQSIFDRLEKIEADQQSNRSQSPQPPLNEEVLGNETGSF